MMVTSKKTRKGVLFAWKFVDFEEATAYTETLRTCVDNLPGDFKSAKFEQICARLIARIKKKDEDGAYSSYLYESETAEFLSWMGPILSAAECFLSLSSEQLHKLYN